VVDVLKRVLVVAFILFVALAALSELVLPRAIARGVEEALAARFGEEADYDVTLKSYPSVRMLLGDLDKVSVVSTNIATADIILSKLAVTLEDASVDLRALLADRDLVVSRATRGEVTITVTAANLRDYLAANVPELKDPDVLITADAVAIAGRLSVAGRDVAVAFAGQFLLTDADTVGLDIQSFSVNDVPVPDVFIETWLEVMSDPDLSLDLSSFPLPVTGKEVTLEDGRLIIEAVIAQGG